MNKKIVGIIGISFISLELLGLLIKLFSEINIPLEPVLWIIANIISLVFIIYGFSTDEDLDSHLNGRPYVIVEGLTNSEADEWVIRYKSFSQKFNEFFCGNPRIDDWVPIKYIDNLNLRKKIRRKIKK